MTETNGARNVHEWLADAERQFGEQVATAKSLSRACAERYVTLQLVWSTFVFTRIVAIAVNIERLLATDCVDESGTSTFDYGCIASLSRDFLEATLMFIYLSENVPSPVWEMRRKVINLHDCKSRIYLFESYRDDAEAEKFRAEAVRLEQDLREDPEFKRIDRGHQQKIIRGERARLTSNNEILVQLNVDPDHYRAMIKLLSSNIHMTPLSWHRMTQAGRGTGTSAQGDLGYAAMTIEYVSQLFDCALQRMSEVQLRIASVETD